jgi:hypothetical protein
MKKAPKGKLFFVHDFVWKHGNTFKFIRHQVLPRKDALALEAAHRSVRDLKRQIDTTGGWKAPNREGLVEKIRVAKSEIRQLTKNNSDVPMREHNLTNPHAIVSLHTARRDLP